MESILEGTKEHTDNEKPLPILYATMLDVEDSVSCRWISGGYTKFTRMRGGQMHPENAPAIAYIP